MSTMTVKANVAAYFTVASLGGRCVGTSRVAAYRSTPAALRIGLVLTRS